jgi:two-component system, LytTR family, response regulator
MIKTIIIDDERPARQELIQLLSNHKEIEIVAEAENSRKALLEIEKFSPDLIFLDIQMPGLSGFDLVSELKEPIPKIIFTTAYDQYAYQAFEVDAVDYLLKPIDPSRLAKSIAKLHSPEEQTVQAAPLAIDDRVLLRGNNRSWFITLSSIRVLEAEGNYSRIIFDDEKPLIYKSLKVLESRLPESTFFRANRSQIINICHVSKVEENSVGTLSVMLRGNNEKVEISRRKAIDFRKKTSL